MKTRKILWGFAVIAVLIIALRVNEHYDIVNQNITTLLFMGLFCLFLWLISVINLKKHSRFKKHACVIKAMIIDLRKSETDIYTPLVFTRGKLETYYVDIEFFDGLNVRRETIEYLGTGKKKLQPRNETEIVYYKDKDKDTGENDVSQFVSLKIESHHLRLAVFSMIFAFLFSILVIAVVIEYVN